jgi:hypothetical protein
VTQFESEKPAMFMIISMTINLPRQLAFEVSPCHTGAAAVSTRHEVSLYENCSLPVDVLMPFPIPAMILVCDKQSSTNEVLLSYLPTIISGTLKDAIWIMAPMLMMVVPRSTHFFLPSGSPIAQTKIAPKKHPMS